jgi:hypothetical protein
MRRRRHWPARPRCSRCRRSIDTGGLTLLAFGQPACGACVTARDVDRAARLVGAGR